MSVTFNYIFLSYEQRNFLSLQQEIAQVSSLLPVLILVVQLCTRSVHPSRLLSAEFVVVCTFLYFCSNLNFLNSRSHIHIPETQQTLCYIICLHCLVNVFCSLLSSQSKSKLIFLSHHFVCQQNCSCHNIHHILHCVR